MNKNVKLKDNNNVLYPESNGGGIDVNNVIANETAYKETKNINIVEDCYGLLLRESNSDYGWFQVNGVRLSGGSYLDGGNGTSIIFLKKGQVLSLESQINYGCRLTATLYGIKHN